MKPLSRFFNRLLPACLLLMASTGWADPRTHLLIFSGQSNMKHLDPDKSVLPALRKAFPSDQCIVVKYAISGQSIRRWNPHWKPPSSLPSGKIGKGKGRPPGDMYKTLLDMVAKALKENPRPDTVTFFWMQGEADSQSAAQWEVYEASLRWLIAQLRKDLQRPDMRFVVGRISDYNGYPEGSAKIRAALVSVAESDPLGAWVDTDDLNGTRNTLHYTAAGYQTLGERFADKAVQFYKHGK